MNGGDFNPAGGYRMASIKLSPSDLTFLWEECPRCFYLKVALGINRPPMAFPSIFSNIDLLMKKMFMGKRTEEILPNLPPGEVLFSGKWVESTPIHFNGSPVSVYIRGIFDSVLRFDDGSYAVIDFKTSQPNPRHIEFYGRQLRAYAYALQHPAPGKLALAPISRLGLLCVEPIDIDRDAGGRIRYIGDVTWLEVPHSEDTFMAFLQQVAQVLSAPEPPPAAEKCAFCKYRAESRTHGW
jgi:hypothetical protein